MIKSAVALEVGFPEAYFIVEASGYPESTAETRRGWSNVFKFIVDREEFRN